MPAQYTKLFILLGLFPALTPLAHGATLINFGGFAADDQSLPAGFADYVTGTGGHFVTTDGGTPNVQLDFYVLQGTGIGGDGSYGHGTPGTGSFLSEMDFATGQGGVLKLSGGLGNSFVVAFTPDPGYAVTIYGWDLLEAPGGGSTNYEWAIQDGATAITSFSNHGEEFSSSEDLTDIGGRTTITDINYTGGIGNTIYLVIQHQSGDAGSFAIDNISFGQTPIPEPGGASLGLVGLSIMMLRRRR